MHGGSQFRSRVSGELEAGSLLGLRVPLLNRVFESSGGANYGNCAVAHAVDLREPARFIMGRHQKDVGAGFDQVCEAIVIGDLDAKSIGKALVQSSEHRFVVDVAGPEYQENHLFGKELRQSSLHKIESLLSSETGDHANDGPLRFLFRNAVLLEQREL